MVIQEIIFYVFASVLTLSALAVITVRNSVYAALFLVLAFFTSAVIWMLLEAEFLAITLVLVYVGAVMVLFLFVVMMLDVTLAKVKEGFAKYLPAGIVVALIMAAEMLLVIWTRGAQNVNMPVARPEGYSNTSELGVKLYTEYLYPFEIAAVILLVAIVAAISLTLRKKRETGRHQNPSRQVKVVSSDRVRIVKMKSEPRDQEGE